MMDETRPSPEDLLQAVQREEKGRKRGRLKIYLGMAAGVGKTYAMLQDAQHLHELGLDLVVGVLNTHGREETASLVEGLKVIPAKVVNYRNHSFAEMDLDELLKLKPALVLVDELAHTNVPGVRHAKRWQDIIELLDHGIDVYSTLNVQHIESLNDVIQSIVEVSVRETVPDLVIEQATSIHLVDITPDELLQRLQEGKVYLGDQSQVAARHFFQKDRLTALREIVLRYTAERVDRDLHGMTSGVDRLISWKPREKLLVAVSHSAHSKKLIRTTRRLASSLDATWVAVHVDDGEFLSEEENNALAKNLSLARDLGAEVITTSARTVADGLERVVRQRGVTQVILGRPPRRHLFGLFRSFSLLDRLASRCPNIDVHVVRKEPTPSAWCQKLPTLFSQVRPYHYLWAFFYVLVCSVADWYLLPYIGYRVGGFALLLAVLCLNVVLRKGPVIFASAFYIAIWGYFFVPAEKGTDLFGAEDQVLMALYFLTALVTTLLVDRVRRSTQMLAKREESTQALYRIVRHIASAPSREELLRAVKERLEALLHGTCEVFVRHLDGGLDFNQPTQLLSDEKEKAAAEWVFQNAKEAGWSTETLPSVQNLYIPLKGYREAVGVLAYRPKERRLLTTDETNFIFTVGKQLANYFERSFAEERAYRAEHVTHEEKIYSRVLKTISKELQSPVDSMQEVLSDAIRSLKEEQALPDRRSVEGQIHRIESTSQRLLRLLDSVSVMAKLSAGIIPIHKEQANIRALIDLCCNRLEEKLGGRVVMVNVDQEQPPVSFDSSLMEILLQSLLTNAVQYSPPQSTIEIETHKEADLWVLAVSDEGSGIPPGSLDAVFETFYRLPGATSPGMGLGLAIARKIAEIHGGSLRAENRPIKGAVFSLFLPVDG